jgi:hypothetical protein
MEKVNVIYTILFFFQNLNSFFLNSNFFIEWHFNDHYLKKTKSNTWFVNGKTFVANSKIKKKNLSYLKPSFDLGICIIQFWFQYIIILRVTSDLDV